MDKFWEGAAAKLADRFGAAAGPALVFWVCGALAWVRGHGRLTDPAGPAARGLAWLAAQPGPVQITILLAVLAAVVASAVLVQQLTLPVLRLLEGYWPARIERLTRALADRHVTAARSDVDAWQELAPRVLADGAQPGDRAELRRFQTLDRRIRRRPAHPVQMMPTRLGNVLRAAETRPVDKYGLDIVAVWPHLWLVLPEQTRTELAAARLRLDAAVAACIWTVAYLVFTPWTLWALLALPAVVLVHRFWLVRRAEHYADLVETTADLYRAHLYRHLDWPLPASPREEKATGRAVTSFLVRGSDSSTPLYRRPADDSTARTPSH
ncbi:hypothetical protein [Nonomuraea sp. NPDC050786]|uniref:hypothetical protein n=1 Tax=Nonomuraea sp. NPDC050786 TaxID=3154840 RepID=UPI0033D572BC